MDVPEGFKITEQTDDKIVLERKKEELISGYTHEQWQHIVDNGFLCTFSDNNCFYRRLSSAPKVADCFIDEEGANWPYCKPANLPGVLQPWFGGDCPVEGGKVVCVLRSREVVFRRAKTLCWTVIGSASDIIAYMVIPDLKVSL